MAKKKVSDAEMRRNRDFMAAQTERMEQDARNLRLSIESVDRVFDAWQSKAETAIKPRRKRKAPLVKQKRAITTKEALALATLMRHGGNISTSARELCIDRKTLKANADRANKKLGDGTRVRSVSARKTLPDNRPRDKNGG